MNKKIFSTVSCGVLVPTVSSSFVLAQDANISNIANVAGENNMADDLFIKNNNESTIEKDLKTKPYLKYFAIAAVLLIADLVARYYIKCSIYEGLNELVDKLLPIYNKATENNLFLPETSSIERLKDSSDKFLLLFLMYYPACDKKRVDLKQLEKGSIKYNILNVLAGYAGQGDGICKRLENYFHSIFGLLELKNELNKLVQQFNKDEKVKAALS